MHIILFEHRRPNTVELCLMLLSTENDESDGNKTFAVYSSNIKVASNIFKQTKTLIDKGSVLWFIL